MHALVWLAVILAPLLVIRASVSAGDGPYGLDASYYVQIARQVMRGEGLTTHVSLYHNGYVLPARATAQPAWVLLLGATARVTGLASAAANLPRVLYAVDLVLLYFLTRALALRFGVLRLARSPLVPDVAHLVTLAFGLNPGFFSATTHPYREALAFAAGFAALLAFARARQWPWLVAASLLAAIAWLARVEMGAIALACIVVLASCHPERERGTWAGGRGTNRDPERPRPPRSLATLGMTSTILFATIFALALIPWFLHLGGLPGIKTWNPIPRHELPVMQDAPRHGITRERVTDWMRGAVVEFDPRSHYSYVVTFGVAALLVPLAAIVLLWRRRGSRDPLVLATTLAGAMMFAALLWYRSDFLPYLFGWRHGLTLVFLIAVAVPFLVAANRWLRLATIGALVVSMVTGAAGIYDFAQHATTAFTPAERQLLSWLAAQPRRPMLLTTHAQTLSVASDALFHNTFCASTPDATRAFLRLFPIDYVVVYEDERRCAFLQGMGYDLKVAQTFGPPGARIFVLVDNEAGARFRAAPR